MKNFYKILFFMIMITGTLISISSLSWLIAWMGLEINLLSIMPLMKNHKNKFSSESTIKYFIVQAMASAMLLFSIIIFSNMKTFNLEFSQMSSIMLNSALMLKLGAAPFHFWFPEVLSGLNWNMAYLIMTWQKIGPMILLTYTIYLPMYLSIIIILSSMVSSIQGLNQSCLRKILAYSSINHISWMIAALLNSYTIWAYYFIIYSIINLNIIMILKTYKIFYLNQFKNIFFFNKKIKFFFMLNFLSLGGLPPFLGFFPKWMTINFLIKNNFYTISIILIIFTLISLYFYIRLSFTTYTLHNNQSIIYNMHKIQYFHFFSNFIILFSLLIMTLFTNY